MRYHAIFEGEEHGLSSYVRKPLDFAALVELVRMLDTSWIRSVEPPLPE